jgi:cytoskeletal protein RodZ
MSSWQAGQVKQLNPDQLEQLKEIGAHLRQIRQQQSIPIEEAAARTFLRLGLVKALEEGQPDQLPEPIFIQGLIRRYGDVLNVDGAAIAQTFPISVLPISSQTERTDSEDVPTAPSFSFEAPSFSIEPYLEYILKPKVGYALLAIAVLGGLFFLLSKLPSAKPTLQTQSSSVATSAKPKTQSSAPIEVKVSLNDDSWLSVIVDGKTQFDGAVKKEYRKTWAAQKELKIKAADAGAVLVSTKGGEPKPIGEVGEAKEVIFTPDK